MTICKNCGREIEKCDFTGIQCDFTGIHNHRLDCKGFIHTNRSHLCMSKDYNKIPPDKSPRGYYLNTVAEPEQEIRAEIRKGQVILGKVVTKKE